MEEAARQFATAVTALREWLDEKQTWLAENVADAPRDVHAAALSAAQAQYAKVKADVVMMQELLHSLRVIQANTQQPWKDYMGRELQRVALENLQRTLDVSPKTTKALPGNVPGGFSSKPAIVAPQTHLKPAVTTVHERISPRRASSTLRTMNYAPLLNTTILLDPADTQRRQRRANRPGVLRLEQRAATPAAALSRQPLSRATIANATNQSQAKQIGKPHSKVTKSAQKDALPETHNTGMQNGMAISRTSARAPNFELVNDDSTENYDPDLLDYDLRPIPIARTPSRPLRQHASEALGEQTPDVVAGLQDDVTDAGSESNDGSDSDVEVAEGEKFVSVKMIAELRGLLGAEENGQAADDEDEEDPYDLHCVQDDIRRIDRTRCMSECGALVPLDYERGYIEVACPFTSCRCNIKRNDEYVKGFYGILMHLKQSHRDLKGFLACRPDAKIEELSTDEIYSVIMDVSGGAIKRRLTLKEAKKIQLNPALIPKVRSGGILLTAPVQVTYQPEISADPDTNELVHLKSNPMVMLYRKAWGLYVCFICQAHKDEHGVVFANVEAIRRHQAEKHNHEASSHTAGVLNPCRFAPLEMFHVQAIDQGAMTFEFVMELLKPTSKKRGASKDPSTRAVKKPKIVSRLGHADDFRQNMLRLMQPQTFKPQRRLSEVAGGTKLVPIDYDVNLRMFKETLTCDGAVITICHVEGWPMLIYWASCWWRLCCKLCPAYLIDGHSFTSAHETMEHVKDHANTLFVDDEPSTGNDDFLTLLKCIEPLYAKEVAQIVRGVDSIDTDELPTKAVVSLWMLTDAANPDITAAEMLPECVDMMKTNKDAEVAAAPVARMI